MITTDEIVANTNEEFTEAQVAFAEALAGLENDFVTRVSDAVRQLPKIQGELNLDPTTSVQVAFRALTNLIGHIEAAKAESVQAIIVEEEPTLVTPTPPPATPVVPVTPTPVTPAPVVPPTPVG